MKAEIKEMAYEAESSNGAYGSARLRQSAVMCSSPYREKRNIGGEEMKRKHNEKRENKQ